MNTIKIIGITSSRHTVLMRHEAPFQGIDAIIHRYNKQDLSIQLSWWLGQWHELQRIYQPAHLRPTNLADFYKKEHDLPLVAPTIPILANVPETILQIQQVKSDFRHIPSYQSFSSDCTSQSLQTDGDSPRISFEVSNNTLNRGRKYGLTGTSIHNEAELLAAENHVIHFDYYLLSPIKATPTHSDAAGKGWQWFQELASQTTVPCYALGGLTSDDLEQALHYGAAGIAGISLLYKAAQAASE